MNSLAIETRGLTRRFGDLVAVDSLDLAVPNGEVFGLVGPDGAGKTTALRLMCGLLDPTDGEARVAGYDVSRHLEAVKDRIGYMAQRFGLYADLTVEENMRFYADLFGLSRPDLDSLSGRLLQMTRMAQFRRRQAGQLSGGMKQKLALMCTLLHRPQILFLDEPTTGVDPVSRRDFWIILYELVKEGLTVFVTTAYLDEAERCGRVGFMHRGRLILCDSPDGLKHHLEETCFEVRAPNQRAARDFLQKQTEVTSAEPAGATVHVFARATAETLRKALHDAGLGPAEVRVIVPSLEDVFIARIRKEGRG